MLMTQQSVVSKFAHNHHGLMQKTQQELVFSGVQTKHLEKIIQDNVSKIVLIGAPMLTIQQHFVSKTALLILLLIT